jgi:hypothetical protein
MPELLYTFALVVVLSTSPAEGPATIIYSFPTWIECKAKELELKADIAGKKNPERVTVDCRRDLRIIMGLR